LQALLTLAGSGHLGRRCHRAPSGQPVGPPQSSRSPLMKQTQAVASSGPGRLSRREVFVTPTKARVISGFFTPASTREHSPLRPTATSRRPEC
jgi:hypothetical protein